MITEIGIIAGEVWKLLNENGEMEFCDLLDRVSAGEEIALMALGWLCREGHILIEGDLPNFKAKLNSNLPKKET